MLQVWVLRGCGCTPSIQSGFAVDVPAATVLWVSSVLEMHSHWETVADLKKHPGERSSVEKCGKMDWSWKRHLP